MVTYFPKMGCHPIPIKLKKSVIGLHQQVLRKSIPSLDWLPIITGLYQTSRSGLGLYMHLSSQLLLNIRSEQGLLKKSNLPEFKWTEECEVGFNNLKQAFISAPILAYPDSSKEFILETDASLKGLGTVLSQRGDDGVVGVITYAS